MNDECPADPFAAMEEPWITPSVRKAIAEKRKAWAQYVAGGRVSHVKLHALHQNACKNVAKAVKLATSQYEENLASQSTKNPKLLYDHVQSKQPVRDRLHAI